MSTRESKEDTAPADEPQTDADAQKKDITPQQEEKPQPKPYAGDDEEDQSGDNEEEEFEDDPDNPMPVPPGGAPRGRIVPATSGGTGSKPQRRSLQPKCSAWIHFARAPCPPIVDGRSGPQISVQAVNFISNGAVQPEFCVDVVSAHVLCVVLPQLVEEHVHRIRRRVFPR
ncbi:hypothetical protein CYLTODRAFT_444528 [Cylindrobasidium torrendii FP15055 ss-10]|uniref:Uncharacterized protein n=1 Tax=Cylindrobasidium torrendii FP15055 ss-10 TaxID=1314674 RepID=A0A0D7B818_9AGAR|nr:hypothetical protein CYLTODRAFT_444528 [Cylindrobasidium torrendii FP15055 ss-10]